MNIHEYSLVHEHIHILVYANAALTQNCLPNNCLAELLAGQVVELRAHVLHELAVRKRNFK